MKIGDIVSIDNQFPTLVTEESFEPFVTKDFVEFEIQKIDSYHTVATVKARHKNGETYSVLINIAYLTFIREKEQISPERTYKAHLFGILARGPCAMQEIIERMSEVRGATEKGVRKALMELFFEGFVEFYSSGTHFLTEEGQNAVLKALGSLKLT